MTKPDSRAESGPRCICGSERNEIGYCRVCDKIYDSATPSGAEGSAEPSRDIEEQLLEELGFPNRPIKADGVILAAIWALLLRARRDVAALRQRLQGMERERDEFHKQLKVALGIPEDGRIWFGTGLLARAESLTAAQVEIQRMRTRLTHVSFAITGNDAALERATPQEVDRIVAALRTQGGESGTEGK